LFRARLSKAGLIDGSPLHTHTPYLSARAEEVSQHSQKLGIVMGRAEHVGVRVPVPQVGAGVAALDLCNSGKPARARTPAILPQSRIRTISIFDQEVLFFCYYSALLAKQPCFRKGFHPTPACLAQGDSLLAAYFLAGQQQ